ncbi:MAG TPA: MFS transporter [Bauldia sp.]|nr:MFS transporter [Bauldia sp.]
MQDSNYRWVIVAAGGLIGCVAMGCLFALPIFLTPMEKATGWSNTGISTAMTIGFLAMAFSSLFWGSLSDRFGPRLVVLVGGVMLAASLYLSSLASTLIAFQLLFGLVAGVAVAAFFAPLMAAVTGWFTTGRSLAVSLVSAGIGIAPVTMTPLSAWLVSHYDWRVSMQILALIAAVIILPATFLLRRPPALEAAAARVPAAVATPTDEVDRSDMTVKQALLSAPFIILAATNFFCCATHSGPIFHTVSYAITCGIAPIAAATIYSVEGIAGMFGRLGFGLVADRLGAKNVLAWGLLIQAFGALGYFFSSTLPAFYAAAALFGFIYAGVMPLYAVLARENFPLRMMGTIIGGTSMAGSLGMATGPLLGGWLYDTTGSYGGLYLTCFGMGLGAFLIALNFRPFPKPVPKAIDAIAA